MSKVSVVVPIYNVETYIEKCARSLFEQTLDDIEYIFIDDCSTDQSIQILENVLSEYSSRENSVKILHLPYNQKQHKARIRGIEEATGDYIIHCDPDDYVDTFMYEALYNAAIEHNVDIVWCGFIKHLISSDTEIHRESCSCDKINILKSLLKGNLMGSLWNKLIRRDLVKNDSIIQPKSPFCEDLLLVSQYVMFASSFYYCDKLLYHYVDRKSSIVSFYGSSCDLILERLHLMKINYDLLYQAVYTHRLENELLSSMIYQKFLLKNSLLPVVIAYKNYSYWINCCSEINFSLFFCRDISLSNKMISLLIFLHIYVVFRRIWLRLRVE